jgi:hypothetical protein
MKRLLVLVLTAAIAVGLYAATAGGTQQAVTPGQFNALKKQVVKLQKEVTQLAADESCLNATPATQFGDPAGQTAGYHYKQPDGTEIITSALDITGSGETPSVILATINTQCLQGLFRLHRVAGGATRH